MIAYTVRLVVELDQPIDDTTARDLAARWAAGLRLDPGLTQVDGTRLAVSGVYEGENLPQYLVDGAMLNLSKLLWDKHYARQWRAVEVVSAAEQARRDDDAYYARRDAEDRAEL